MADTTDDLSDYAELMRALRLYMLAHAALDDAHPDEFGALHGLADSWIELQMITEERC